jgi:hypothetical protein
MVQVALEWITNHPLVVSVVAGFTFNRIVTAAFVEGPYMRYACQIAVYIGIYFLILNVKLTVDQQKREESIEEKIRKAWEE